MKIRRVKRDSDDLTISLPSAILPGLNADFDGDVINEMGFPLEDIHVFFEHFSPTSMIINRTDSTIRLDVSALENISIAIASDR